MNNEKIKYILGGTLLGGGLVGLITLSPINSARWTGNGMMGLNNRSSQTYSENANTIDAHFIEQMIPHHEDAITMAKIAATKAQKNEIKELAKNIIESQSKEISEMKSWYKTWFGKDVPAGNQVMNEHGMMTGNGIHMGMMGNDSDMNRLESEQNFDKAFIEEMIPHHQMAVMMANMLANGTQKPEMKKLADDIISAQTKEINQMRQWYTEWGYDKYATK